MDGTSHTFRRVVADPNGAAIESIVEQTVYTNDGEAAATIIAETEAHFENALRDSGRAWVELPANAARPTPGGPFPKPPTKKP